MPPIQMPDADRLAIAAHAGARIALIAASFRRLTGRALAPPAQEAEAALWEAPAVIVAHGTGADPVFFYGNRAALDLFGMPARDFIRLPSRFSAEPVAREERARLLAQVARQGFISDYAGVRIARSGERFRIEQATVWNLLAADGSLHGQAACFARWTPLAAEKPSGGD